MEILLHRRPPTIAGARLARPAKRLAAGDRIVFGETSEGIACELGRLMATVESKAQDGEVDLAFDFYGAILDEAIERFGHMPLPPYIAKRSADDERDRCRLSDRLRARSWRRRRADGGIASHSRSLDAISAGSVQFARVTLHVGAGTFLPVKADDTRDHRMHPEWGRIDARPRRRSTRPASAADASSPSARRPFASWKARRRPTARFAPFEGETSIFITPGYRFRAVDGLMTNFHLPRSTLFMLVCALAGSGDEARLCTCDPRDTASIHYGDASLLWPQVRS